MDKKYYCEYIEKGVFTVEDIFYSIKNFEFVSLFLWYNDELKTDLYLYAWLWPKAKLKSREPGKEVEVEYWSVYVWAAAWDCVELYTEWWVDWLKKLIDKYYTDWD